MVRRRRRRRKPMCPTPSSGCSSVTATRARPTAGTDALTQLSGSHRLVLRWCGSARRAQGGDTTGTRSPVPVRMSSLCLLSEAYRGEGLGIPSLPLGCHSWSLCTWQSCSVSWCCLRCASSVTRGIYSGYRTQVSLRGFFAVLWWPRRVRCVRQAPLVSDSHLSSVCRPGVFPYSAQ